MSNEEVGFLNPDNYTAGRLDKVEVTVSGVEVIETEYVDPETGERRQSCAVQFELTDDDGAVYNDKNGVFPYSVGSLKDWQPSPDGSSIVNVGGKKGINKNATFAHLNEAAVKGGLPKGRLNTANIRDIYLGVRVFVEQVPTGKKSKKGDDKTLALFTKIVSLPEEAKKSSKKSSSASASASGGGNGADKGTDTETMVRKLTAAILAKPEFEDGISFEALSSEVYQAVVTTGADRATRKAVNTLFSDDEFIKSNSGAKTWVYNEKNGRVEAP